MESRESPIYGHVVMSHRFVARFQIVLKAFWQRVKQIGRRRPPVAPRRILVAHDLLLGDTLMLVPLLARLRAGYPLAEIVMTTSPKFSELFDGNPYGVRTIPFSPYSTDDINRIIKAEFGFDLAIIPGDNRHALFALAAGAKWIVAFDEDRPIWKNIICDELRPFPQRSTTLDDLFTLLAPETIARNPSAPILKWPSKDTNPSVPLPPSPYAVLHVGAGNPLRYWPSDRWNALAIRLQENNITPVFCCGPGEEALVRAANPDVAFNALEGRRLGAVWQLIEKSDLLVCLDSGISHLAKIIGTPTIVLYGPGSPLLFGAGECWQRSKFRPVWTDNIECRNQHHLFRRQRDWILRCSRKPSECHHDNQCMAGITVERVEQEALRLLKETGKSAQDNRIFQIGH